MTRPPPAIDGILPALPLVGSDGTVAPTHAGLPGVPELSPVQAALLDTTAGQPHAAFDALSGEAHAGAATAGLEGAHILGDAVLDRLTDIAGSDAGSALAAVSASGHQAGPRYPTCAATRRIPQVRLHRPLHPCGPGARASAALDGSRSVTDVQTTTLGFRSETPLAAGWPVLARTLLGWRHAFGGITPGLALAFAGQSGSFAVSGPAIAQDAAVGEVGFDYLPLTNLRLGVSYTGQPGANASDKAVKGRFEVVF